MLTSWNIEYWRRVHQLNIQVIRVLEYRDGKQTDTFMSRCEKIFILYTLWLAIDPRTPLISVIGRISTFITLH